MSETTYGRFKIYDGTPSGEAGQALNDNFIAAEASLDALETADTLGSLSEDTTPRLGGDLDVQTHSIVTTDNRNINITPHGTGQVVLKDLTFPAGDGSAGQLLSTDGSGNLSFIDDDAGLENLVEDTSPQLGGDLDVQTHKITTTTTNGNMVVSPIGTGAFQTDSDGDSRGDYAVDLQRSRSNATEVASGNYSVIGGGRDITASGPNSTVGGGESNTASGYSSTIGGGNNNEASSYMSTIGGGSSNEASSYYSTVGGGESNTASGYYSTIGGGAYNEASGAYSTIGGGGGGEYDGNVVEDDCSFIGGGSGNTISSGSGDYKTHNVISGGEHNTISENLEYDYGEKTIGGGGNNTVTGTISTIGGGGSNTANGDYSTIGGGASNTTENFSSTIGGGLSNLAEGDTSTIGGGAYNEASGDYSTIGGGGGGGEYDGNVASGDYSTIGGGNYNEASGNYSTVPGGIDNVAEGDFSVAMGRRAKTGENNDGVFIFADSEDEDFEADTADSFNIRAGGGLRLLPSAEPATPSAGTIYYDSTENKLKLYNGTAWETITSVADEE